MKWLSYVSPSDGSERVGLLVGNEILGGAPGVSLIDLLRQGGPDLTDAAAKLRFSPAELWPADSVVLRAPVPVPPSIRDFMGFEDHAVNSLKAVGLELSKVWYELPVFYFTNPAAVRGHKEAVAISPGSTMFDYELEVAAVIGKAGSDIAVEDAGAHMAGFLIFCDWSARDLQMHEMQIGLGPTKGKDTATSFGPWMVTPDELAFARTDNGYDLQMTATVNGMPYSSGRWSEMYWTFEQMISYASRGTTLVPGDIIGSGTVGTGCILELSRVHGTDAYPWLKPGDEVVLTIEQLGSIRSTVTAGQEPKPLRQTYRP
jgi:2-keto-4-pentenoate hydratase/2-oxohepta-3-ene-1,7-dioic acid hydratase in catechol pathway